jgi:Protein of unknown function (DUF3352)
VPPIPTPPTQTESVPETPRPAATPRVLALAGGALLVVIVIIAAALATGGSGQQPPATGAATLVPGDALAYVNVSIDPNRPAVKRALRLAGRLPTYPVISAAVQTRLDGLAGGSGSPSFATDIRPWLGNEAALALLNTPSSTAGSLIVLDVRDHARARSFLAQAGAIPAATYRGTELLRYPSGTELAFVGRYLVLGQDASVRSALDVRAGARASLQGTAAYQRAAAGEPADRVLDAYVSASGVQRVLAAQRGLIGAIGALLYQPALAGVTMSVSAASGGVRVRVHTVLDPTLARASGAHPSLFNPTLAAAIPSGSMLMLDVTGLDKLARRVLSAGAAGGLAGRVGPLLSRLGSALGSEGVNVSKIVSLFEGESAVAITNTQHPALTIVARTGNEAQARSELAALELPLEELFPAASTGPGQAPVFNDREVNGITVHQLALAPGLQLNYTVANGFVIVSTSLTGVTTVAERTHTLAEEPIYKSAFTSRPQRVASLLFLDFNQLLNLAEQTGLTRSATYSALRPDLRKVRTVGLESTSGEADSTAELFLQIT